MKEKPRFYCDNCGAEVPQEAKECPACGRSFGAVRCPQCGFTGEAWIFDTGCPNCGYAVSEAPPESSPPQKIFPKPPPQHSDALPLWVYLVTGAVFLGVLGLLYFSLVSP